MTDATGSGDAAGTGALAANDLPLTKPLDAGRLRREWIEMLPGSPLGLDSKDEWQSAAEHGATPKWALRTAGTTVNEATADLDAEFSVWYLLCLASLVPVGVIEGLLADGWTINEMADMMDNEGYDGLVAGGFSETANRLRALHQTVPGIGGPDGALLWHALAAVLSAGDAGLTDLQTLRWIQVLMVPTQAAWMPPQAVLAASLADSARQRLQEWVPIAGPDGWAWAAAGYTPDETRMLIALHVGHPDRPGPDQLAVMAALRQRRQQTGQFTTRRVWDGRLVTDATGSGNATGAGGFTANDLHQTAARLKREWLEILPSQPLDLPSENEWQSATKHGATPGWALQTIGMTADEAAADSDAEFLVWGLLCLAVEVPVGVIERLLVAGWDLAELSDLMDSHNFETIAAGGFSETARRLGALHQTVPGIGGPNGTLLWHALGAVLSAGSAGLTDLQALRWLQVLGPNMRSGFQSTEDIPRIILADSLAQEARKILREWVAAAGPDGWAWFAAGYTPDETRVLCAFPVGHPDRPGPDQLAVMAALRRA